MPSRPIGAPTTLPSTTTTAITTLRITAIGLLLLLRRLRMMSRSGLRCSRRDSRYRISILKLDSSDIMRSGGGLHPDTFCSYDYSACTRERGFVSLRYRLARIALYQLIACSDILRNADRVAAHPYVSCEPQSVLYSVRVCSYSGARVFFVRKDATPQIATVKIDMGRFEAHLEDCRRYRDFLK